jgi:hypothetical protein
MRRLLLALGLLVRSAAPVAAEPFVDRVVSTTIGTGGGGGAAGLPGIVLGPPRGGGAFEASVDHVLSLGIDGSIVL